MSGHPSSSSAAPQGAPRTTKATTSTATASLRRLSTGGAPASIGTSSGASGVRSSSGSAGSIGKDATARKMEAMEAQREARRRAMQERRLQRVEENERNAAAGNPGDVDFIGLVRSWRADNAGTARPLVEPEAAAPRSSQGRGADRRPFPPRICVAVRKRPISDKERDRCDHDSVTVLHPKVWIHAAKLKVDGIRKYLDHSSFEFDYAFDERSETSDVYRLTTLPLLEFVVRDRGRATVFSYGQTGSGKTHTVQGIQALLARDLFALIGRVDGSVTVSLSMYELYGGSLHDLLNDRKRLKVLEDGKGEINVTGLVERSAPDAEAFHSVLEEGNAARTTHTTQANDSSSRSHAICTILLRSSSIQMLSGQSNRTTVGGQQQASRSKLLGKLALVDLAGSERGNDTTSHNAQRRAESADINTSLLALKECIRAMGASDGDSHTNRKHHIPCRQSKLTLILKDCLVSEDARTTMIATVSPGASSVDHSLNTLRYADRVKDRPSLHRQHNRSRTPPHPRSKPLPNPAVRPTSPSPAARPVGQPPPKLASPSAPPSRGSHSSSSRNPGRGPAGLASTSPADSPLGGVALTATSSSDESLLIAPIESTASSNRAEIPAIRSRDDDDDGDGLGYEEGEYNGEKRGRLDRGTGTDASIDHSDPRTDHDSDDHPLSDVQDDKAPSETGEGDTSDLEMLQREEEDILNTHMSDINENAELLGWEGSILQGVQRDGATWDEVEQYARTLETMLDRREDMIRSLQSRMEGFEARLVRRQQQHDQS